MQQTRAACLPTPWLAHIRSGASRSDSVQPGFFFASLAIAAALGFGLLGPSAGCSIDTNPLESDASFADGSSGEPQAANGPWDAWGSAPGTDGQAENDDRAPSSDGGPGVLEDEDGISSTGSDSNASHSDASAAQSPHDDPGVGEGEDGISGEGPDSDASAAEGPDVPSDAGTDAGVPPSPPAADNGDASGGAGCVGRPLVTGCDPTIEGGCPDLMQCVIDLLAPTPTGYCVFSTPMGAGMCVGSPMTESCPPTFTCFGGFCQELCLCDEDCSTGRCCGEPVGAQGFKLCADC